MSTTPTSQPPVRGELRVLLGAAPGVGKTYAMLNEGTRRKTRGTDVVIGFVETHGRANTAAQIGNLKVLPRRTITHKGAEFTEMDVDAILARKPQLALVDELAHTNVTGSRNARRCQDVEELLDAGIDVITTVNVQHLESLNDVVATITGVRQRETVPDAVVRGAEQIELVDMSPEALRRRMAHGNVYAPEKVDSALRNYFRPGNLAALRELALLWVADRVDAGLADYRKMHDITGPWPTRERVVVALSGGPEGDALIRRGARIASKGVGGELIAVYVARSDGLINRDTAELVRQQKLVQDLSGSFHTLTGDDPAQAVLDFAHDVNASQIVLGQTRFHNWQRVFRTPVSQKVIEGSGEIDVHIVSHTEAGSGSHRRPTPPLSRHRRALGMALAVVLPLVLTAVIGHFDLETANGLPIAMFLSAAVVVALVGGVIPALIAAVLSSVLANWFFTPPLHTLTIAAPENIVGLILFVIVAAAVAMVVDRAAREARLAVEARAEADTLFLLSSQAIQPGLTVDDVLQQIRTTFRLDGVAYRLRRTPTSEWQVPKAVGHRDGGPSGTLTLAEGREFALYGRGLTAAEQRVLSAFGEQVMNQFEREELAAAAATADELADRNAFQTALLAAVSHDLRTPLASIKASSSSLLASDVALDPADQRMFVELIDDNADRLGRLIGNLLDMTRIQTGAMAVLDRSVLLDEVLRPALTAVDADRVKIDSVRRLPMIATDPGLAERILANLIDNGLRHQPPDKPLHIAAQRLDDRLEVRISDNGPGVPPNRRKVMFEPFQRVGDAPRGNGLGLGLAVAAGFANAVGATLEADDTPGGGLTMVVSFPVAKSRTGARA